MPGVGSNTMGRSSGVAHDWSDILRYEVVRIPHDDAEGRGKEDKSFEVEKYCILSAGETSEAWKSTVGV